MQIIHVLRFGSGDIANEFSNILNSPDIQVQHDNEYENDNKELIFFGHKSIRVTNNGNYSYNFTVYIKLAITNIQVKLHDNLSPNKTIW